MFVQNVEKSEIEQFVDEVGSKYVNDTFLSRSLNLPIGCSLDQLAEESAELIQACLKLKRAMGLANPTATSIDDAIDNLLEELADVSGSIEIVTEYLKKLANQEKINIAADDVDKIIDKTYTYKRARALMRHYGYGRKFIKNPVPIETEPYSRMCQDHKGMNWIPY